MNYGGYIFLKSSLKISKIFGIYENLVVETFSSIVLVLPNVMLIIVAINQNCTSLAIGNCFGTILINICLILGLLLLVVQLKTIRKANLNRLLVMFFLLLILSVLALLNCLNVYVGIMLLLGFFLYFIKEFTKEKNQLIEKGKIKEVEILQNNNVSKGDKLIFFVEIIFELLILFCGSLLIVGSSKSLIASYNINGLVLGLTIVSLGSSLPQLWSILLSIKKKKINLALKNQINSNIFSLFLLFSILMINLKTGVILSRLDLLILVPIMLLVANILILPMLIGKRTYKWQGIILLILYAIYDIFVIFVK